MIEIDERSATPIFEQIANAFETAILEGRIQPEESLPSSRELARSLFLARGTVVRAYDILRERGLLESVKGKHLTVAASQPAFIVSPESRENESDSLYSLGLSQVAESSVEDVMKAAVPRKLLPVKRWRELIIKNCAQVGQVNLNQNEVLGSLDLRKAVCDFLANTRGVVCEPQQVSVYTNTDQAIDTVARLLIKPNDPVVVEEPGYFGAANIFSFAGARVIRNGIDEQGMLIPPSDSSARLLYATPTSQDPTGIVMSEQRKAALINWAKRNSCIIFEDGWDTDFWHARKPAPCMQQKDPEQIIYLYSFWKVLFPLSNASFLVMPRRLSAQLEEFRSILNRPPISIELIALTDLLKSGEIYSLISKIQKAYRNKRRALTYNLSKTFGESIKILKTGGGTHILVSFNPAKQKRLVLESVRECGLKFISMDDYYSDKRSTGCFVIFFTHIDLDTVAEQVQRFAALLMQS